MTDWQRLVDLRERRRTIALDAVGADQRAADQRASEARQAQSRVAQCEAAKTDHWQATAAADGLSVGQLCDAAAGSRALDARIAAARSAFDDALEQVHASERLLQASRERLRRAAGGVEKAGRMQERTQEGRRRDDEARIDAATEDFAAARWSMRNRA